MTLHNIRRCGTTLIVAIAACQAMTGSSSSVTAAELLGYWQLEETEVDAEAIDSSGNGWNGEYEGDVDPNVEGAPGFGSGAYFDGETGQIFLGPGDENGFGDLTSDFTVMAWINPDQFDTKNRVFGSPIVSGGWGWGTAGDSLQITTWGVKDYTQPVPLELEEWTHAAVVLNEDFEADFYVNGEYVGTQTHPSEGNPTVSDFYIGWACCNNPQEHFSGLLDEVGVFSGALTEEQILNAMTLGVSNYDGGGGLPCDYDGDGSLGVGDINILSAAIAGGDMDPKFDVNKDGTVNVSDLNFFVTDESKLYTWIGDANLDGSFNSSDLVAVFTAGNYEVDVVSKWEEGDWNADLRFGSGDLVAAFTDGGYEVGPKGGVPAAAVPEPSSIGLILFGGGVVACLSRRRRSSSVWQR